MRNVKNQGSKGRVPLYRALSKLGRASREEAKELIIAGKVKVHGSVETNPDRPVNPDMAHIEVLGEKTTRSEAVLVLFHKPKGCLTTKRDPEGRKTIYDFLPKELQRLHPVGRLDQHTSGLLLLTNDTKLSNYLTDPKNDIPRTYIVEVRGEFTGSDRTAALEGIHDDGDLLRAKELKILKASGRESRIEITLTEGKNREIRRMCLALRHEVVSLKRIRFGVYALDMIRPGEYRIFKDSIDFV